MPTGGLTICLLLKTQQGPQLLPVMIFSHPPNVKAQLSKVLGLGSLVAFYLLHPRLRNLALGTVALATLFLLLIHRVHRRPNEQSCVGTHLLGLLPKHAHWRAYPDTHMPPCYLLSLTYHSALLSWWTDHPGHTSCHDTWRGGLLLSISVETLPAEVFLAFQASSGYSCLW